MKNKNIFLPAILALSFGAIHATSNAILPLSDVVQDSTVAQTDTTTSTTENTKPSAKQDQIPAPINPGTINTLPQKSSAHTDSDTLEKDSGWPYLNMRFVEQEEPQERQPFTLQECHEFIERSGIIGFFLNMIFPADQELTTTYNDHYDALANIYSSLVDTYALKEWMDVKNCTIFAYTNLRTSRPAHDVMDYLIENFVTPLNEKRKSLQMFIAKRVKPSRGKKIDIDKESVDIQALYKLTQNYDEMRKYLMIVLKNVMESPAFAAEERSR